MSSQELKQTRERAVEIREVSTIGEYDACIALQRAVFGLPDLEISPRRHLIVSRMAGGWTLGAFIEGKLVGFVHHMAAAHGDRIFGYSHMMAVAVECQNRGVGAQLKWAQRERAMALILPSRQLEWIAIGCLRVGSCARRESRHCPKDVNLRWERPTK